MDKDLKNKTAQEIVDLVAERDGRSFWASYLFQFVHAKHVTDIHAISPLPKAFRQSLIEDGYFISRLETVDTFCDPDGTVKFLLACEDGRRLECVRLTDDDRHTLCISSQVGCRMGCRFCATGRLSFAGNLTAGQIVDQVYRAVAYGGPIHNLVYMGMGEPLDNLDAVLKSVRILIDPEGVNIGQRHMTISTCGLPEEIEQLAQSKLQVRLAISLHAPEDDLRSQLMPINRRFTIASVLAAVRDYQKRTHRRVTFEYCLIQAVNDSPEKARALAQLLRGIQSHVNLIEFNEFPSSHYRSSDRQAIADFSEVLRGAGIETVVRYKRGRSIKAACGQLGATWLKQQ